MKDVQALEAFATLDSRRSSPSSSTIKFCQTYWCSFKIKTEDTDVSTGCCLEAKTDRKPAQIPRPSTEPFVLCPVNKAS